MNAPGDQTVNTSNGRSPGWQPTYGAVLRAGQMSINLQNTASHGMSESMTAGMTPGRRQSGVGTTISARYELVEELGAGGMGCVYKARHIALNKFFALKLLLADYTQQPEFVLRFDQEAKTAGLLSHPNLVAVYDYGLSENNEAFIVMDLLEGMSLAARLKKQKRLPVKQAVPLFLQICDGLAYAHRLGIIHRDLKPANVMLTTGPAGVEQAKVVDFGIAKAPKSEQRLTKTGDIFGSPFYMSPEQCSGEVPDHRSDIYSIGCLMYECLTSSPPFVGQNSFATMMMHNDVPPRPFSRELKTPRALENIVLKALAKDPNQRFQSMRELKNELQLLEKPGDLGHESASGRSASLGSVRTWAAAVGIACGAMVASLVGYQLLSAGFIAVPNSTKPVITVPSTADASRSASKDDQQASQNKSRLLPASAQSMSLPQLISEARKCLDNSKKEESSDLAKAHSDRELGFAYLAEAIRRYPTLPEPYSVREEYDWDFRLFEQGTHDCEKLVAIEPGNADSYDMLGTFYCSQGRNKEALKAESSALEISPGNPHFLEKRGFYYYCLQDFHSTIRDFKDIACSTRIHTMQMLADSYIKTGQPKKGLDVISQFFRTKPEDLPKPQLAFAYSVKAEAENALNKYDQAVGDLKMAMSLDSFYLSRKDELRNFEALAAQERASGQKN